MSDIKLQHWFKQEIKNNIKNFVYRISDLNVNQVLFNGLSL